MSTITLISAADLHLGRHVGSIQKSYVIQAWENLIDTCIEHTPKIDALLLAGDVIDGDHLFIEMYGILKKGIERLLECNIKVIAVAGNHDPQVLNQMSQSLNLPGFHLLGVNGEWERLTLHFDQRNLHIDGFSFTRAYMDSNPLDQYNLPSPCSDDLLLGLLHCDVGASSSKYAPVALTDFCKMPHAAWILGHIHIPKRLLSSPVVYYCGSLQGLDVSEHGARGASLITISENNNISFYPLPLAPLRWESISLDLSSLKAEDWEGKLFQKIESTLLNQIQEESLCLEMIGVRLILEGRTEIFRALRRYQNEIQEQDSAGINFKKKWIPYFIESIQNKTRPSYDLERLAEGSDLVGTLAKKLLNFQKQDAFTLYDYLEDKYRKDSSLKQCPEAWLTPEECEELFFCKGYELLDELLEQKQK